MRFYWRNEQKIRQAMRAHCSTSKSCHSVSLVGQAPDPFPAFIFAKTFENVVKEICAYFFVSFSRFVFRGTRAAAMNDMVKRAAERLRTWFKRTDFVKDHEAYSVEVGVYTEQINFTMETK